MSSIIVFDENVNCLSSRPDESTKPAKDKMDTDERRLDNLSIHRIFNGEKKKTIFVINDFYRDKKIRTESRNREFGLIIEM